MDASKGEIDILIFVLVGAGPCTRATFIETNIGQQPVDAQSLDADGNVGSKERNLQTYRT